MTVPEEGPEQRWRRTVRKRPAKLKLGRLLRDFGYTELDTGVAEAIESRMASVGLAVRPSLHVAAADEIVTVYRSTDSDEPSAAPPPSPAPPTPAPAPAPAAAEPARARPRRAADPGAERAITDLKGQLADARAETARLRAELDNRITAMAEAERAARERLSRQMVVVEDQARQVEALNGLLSTTREALAEARDEVRRAVGDLPAEIVDAPVEGDALLDDEEGWLTDAEEAPVALADEVRPPVEPPGVAGEPGPGDGLGPVDADAVADDVFEPDVAGVASAQDEFVLEPEPAPPGPEPPEPEGFAPAAGFPPAEEADPAPAEDVFEPDSAGSPDAYDEDTLLDADLPPLEMEDVFSLDPPAPDGDAGAFPPEPDSPPLQDGAPIDAGSALGDEPASVPEAPAADAEPADLSGATMEWSLDDEGELAPPGAAAEASGSEELTDAGGWRIAGDEPPSGELDAPPEPAEIEGLFYAPEELEPDPDGLFAGPVQPPPEPDFDPAVQWPRDPEARVEPPPIPAPAEPDPAFALPDPPQTREPERDVFDLPPEPGDLFADPPPEPELEGLAELAPTTDPDLDLGGLDPAGEPADALADLPPAPDAAGWPEEPTTTLPPPPPLPPSPFADEPLPPPPPAPVDPSPRTPRQPARRGRMARGRGRWEGTCSVCERFPEVTRRKDLEAAGWQLDGDFPTCPQCRGLP